MPQGAISEAGIESVSDDLIGVKFESLQRLRDLRLGVEGAGETRAL